MHPSECRKMFSPTISGVPGEMISFKYNVEVVVDLGGKLAAQGRHMPRVGTVVFPSSFGSTSARGAGNPNMLAAWGGSIIDTDHIRREKSVVCCLFEVLVGSTDSARKRGRGNNLLRKPVIDWPVEAPRSPGLNHDPILEESITPSNHDQRLPVGEELADQILRPRL